MAKNSENSEVTTSKQNCDVYEQAQYKLGLVGSRANIPDDCLELTSFENKQDMLDEETKLRSSGRAMLNALQIDLKDASDPYFYVDDALRTLQTDSGKNLNWTWWAKNNKAQIFILPTLAISEGHNSQGLEEENLVSNGQKKDCTETPDAILNHDLMLAPDTPRAKATQIQSERNRDGVMIVFGLPLGSTDSEVQALKDRRAVEIQDFLNSSESQGKSDSERDHAVTNLQFGLPIDETDAELQKKCEANMQAIGAVYIGLPPDADPLQVEMLYAQRDSEPVSELNTALGLPPTTTFGEATKIQTARRWKALAVYGGQPPDLTEDEIPMFNAAIEKKTQSLEAAIVTNPESPDPSELEKLKQATTAIKYGLASDSTQEEIQTAQSEYEQMGSAILLGLSPKASTDEIEKATLESHSLRDANCPAKVWGE
jgi:hypothetical protein